jgi:dihydroneopterin aldolase
MDKIFVTGLELWLRLGCTPEERAFPQRVELDVELELDLREPGASDDLSKTADYARVAALLKTSLENEPFRLAEAAAEKAAALALRSFPVRAATVRVRKRALPGVRWAGVEIRRSHDPEGS